MSASSSAECLAGERALKRGDWTDARDCFERALDAGGEDPAALEGLGLAAWWLDLAEVVFDSRERAYRAYLAKEDRRGAARVAVWLAWDCWAFRGENAVADGWLRRARRLLEHEPDCAERAWLEIREGSLLLLEAADPERAHTMAAEGIRIAKAAHSIDLEMLGHAVQGLALVSSGAVVEGMQVLDEVNAAVLAGELSDLVVIGLASCYLISACDRVRDYDRAEQWCRRLKEFCVKWGFRPLFAVCRTQYASLCLWRGTWTEAEEELEAASTELASSRPAMTGDALVRLAELRRRQGRLSEAADLFEQAGSNGLAVLGRAELALDSGDFRAAAEHGARYLRQVPLQNRTGRANGLDVLVRAHTALKEWDAAKRALAELSTIATIVNTAPLRAVAAFSAGYLAFGQGAPETARPHLEDAVDLYLSSGAPFEVARARIELARALSVLGRSDAAADEARRAISQLSDLRAEFEMAKAQRLLESMTPASVSDAQKIRSAGLTKREVEVLRLVAEGFNNQTIAERLFVSDHTVHRHLANILSKLSVSTRAAAVAQASRRGLLG